MNKVAFEKKFIPMAMITFSVLVYIIGIFIVSNKMSWTLGLAFGLIFSLLKLKLMEKTIGKAILLSPAKAKNYMNMQYMLRYGLTAIVLIIAALESSISLLGVFFGLLSMKIGAYATIWMKKRQK
ncbi:ATP synthase subunit I [Cellulosilyticum ruminicola]|uniref:ATP synthase subunit I n=1 Tax=Cellulosilyticum ruminicola TaxID=425254 RepID=UPI0006D0B68D|nr:ATP synthase subunit I [Cellulosilyticum ruminicola]